MSEWISTKDRLPKTNEMIIFWSTNCSMARIGALYARSGKFISDGDKFYVCEVSHWMAIEPPK